MATTTTGRTGLSEPPGGQERHRPSLKEVLPVAAAAVGLLGVVLSGLQYWAVERYYAPVGITPEQAGMDSAVMLTRLVTTLGLLACVTVPTALFFPSVLALADDCHVPQLTRLFRERRWIRTLTASSLVGVAFSLTSLTYGPSVPEDFPFWLLWLMGTGLAAPTLSLAGRARRFHSLLRLLITVGWIAVYIGIAVGQLMGRQGTTMAESCRPSSLAAALGVRPQFTHAAFVQSPGMPKRTDGPVVNLGEHSGTYALWDCASHTRLFIPVVQVQLSGVSGMEYR